MRLKKVLPSVILILSLLLSGNVMAADINGVKDGQESKEVQVLYTLFTSDADSWGSLFSEAMLQQITPEMVEQVIQQYKDRLGELEGVTADPAGFVLTFERGTAPANIVVDANGQIAGLLLGAWTLKGDNLEAILTDFSKLKGRTSITILKNNEQVLLDYNGDQPMGIGSAFKLYVLKAVYDKVESGKGNWNDVIDLTSVNRSLPTGTLQDWPEKTPVTVRTLTNLMISISDNTATDHLIDYVGREAVEKLIDQRNIPLLKTSEVFKLKFNGDLGLAVRYLEGTVAEQRAMLKDLQKIELDNAQVLTTPTLINEMEWFFTTRELCKIIYELKGAEEIQINPGLAAGQTWNLAGYKGGSEPGVLNLTHILQKDPGGDIYTLSVTVNNALGTLDENQIFQLTSRLIDLVRAGNLPEVPPMTYFSLFGPGRYDSSLALLQSQVEKQGDLPGIMLATGEDWYDYLAGSSLAGQIGVPLLMIPPTPEQAGTQFDFMVRNLKQGGTVYLVGGANAIGSEYITLLSAAGFTVQRLWGGTAAETALAVAGQFIENDRPVVHDKAVIVGQLSFEEAVYLAAYSYDYKVLVLYTDPKTLNSEVVEFLQTNPQIREVYVAGGEEAVSQAVLNELNRLGKTVQRM